MSKTIKKSVSIFTTVTTTIWMSGVLMAVPMVTSAAIVDGDLIRNPNAEGLAQFDIYIVKLVGTKMFKRLILSPHVFESYGHLEWGDVQDVSATVMAEYTTSELVREIDDTKVYKLTPDGDTGAKQWMNMTAADFEADGWDWDSIYIINNTDRDAYTTGTDCVAGGDCEGGGVVVSEGTLTVTLAADTPSAGTAVENAARYPFTKVNMTATGGDVIVNTMVIERTGLGQDASITSVDIVDADTNLPLNATSKTFNSDHRGTVTEDVTIESGTTKSFLLTANMPADLASYAGETPSLSLADVTVKGNATVNASFPITGNVMTINNTITIGTATVQRGAYTNATSTTIQVGKQDYTFFSFQIQAGSTEKVEFSQIKVYQEGSAGIGTDLVDFELLRDGTLVADGTVLTSKYVLFNFDMITLNKGETAQFQVKADVEDGSARTVDLGIYKTTDMLVKGVTYGYNITPTYSSTGASTANPVLSDNQFTISNGTLQVTRSNSVPAGNIGVSTDQWLGSYEFDCKGEPIDISSVVLTIVSSGGGGQIEDALMGLELVQIHDDGTEETVAGPTDITNGVLTVTWSDTFTVPTGKTTYKVRGDLQVNGGWASDDTIYVQFTPGDFTATGEVTGNSITPTPASALSGNTQTVKAAALTVTRNTIPADAYIIVNQDDVVLSSWNFDGSDSGEDIRVTSILWAGKGQAATNTDALTTFIDENKNGTFDEGTDTVLSPSNDNLSSTNTSSTFAFTEPIIVTKGTSKHIGLKADKDSVTSNDSEQWGLGDATASVVAYGKTTGNSVDETITVDHGPTLTSTVNGTLTIETSGNPSIGIVTAGSIGNVFTKIKLTAKYETLDVDEIVVFVADGGHSWSDSGSGEYRDVTNLGIYDGTTKLGEASIPSTGKYTFNLSKGDLEIPAGALNAKTITVKADMATIDPDSDNAPGTANADLKIGIGGIDGIKTTGQSSNNTLSTTSYEVYRSSTSSIMVLKNSKPTVTLPTTSNSLGAATALTNGNIPLYAFKVTADTAGEILLYRATFVLATSGGVGEGMALANVRLDDQYGNTIKAAAAANAYTTDSSGEYWYTATFNNPDFSVGDDKEAIKIPAGESRTFKLYGTVTGASNGENFTTFLVGDLASTSDDCNNMSFAQATNSMGWTAVAGADLSDRAKGNFLWSDNWMQKSFEAADGNNATGVPQWYNGYLVSGLGKQISTTPYVISY